MKKMLTLFILLLIPCFVRAGSFSVGMHCPKGAGIGETISCKITASAESISKLSISFDAEGLPKSNISFVKNNGLNFASADNNGFVLNDPSGSIEIGTLNVLIPSDATESSKYKVILNNISAVDTESNTINYDNITSTISIKSSDNSLSSLSVGNYQLSPAFNKDTLSYKVNVDDVPKITINATSSDSDATISGAGEVSLKYGDNTKEVVVTSASGISKTYKIIINRFDSRDKTNTLNNLVVAGYDLDQTFDPKKTTYSTTVDSNVTEIKITAELTPCEEDNKIKSSFVKNYGPRTVKKLKYGKNTVQVKVRAENETVRTYTINVTRIDDRDPNNYLKTLEISSGRYTFNKEINSYTINVENQVSIVSVKAIAESEKSTVTSPAKVELKEGSNKIKITVVAENETKREYNITINRLKKGTTIEEVENITYLKSLKIVDKNINFHQKIISYEIPITTENEITFSYELFDDIEGTIEIKDDETGPIKLSSQKSEITMAPIHDGSVIYLNLMTKEGYSRQFTFNVKTADYYIGDIDIPVEKEKLVIKWTWQLIVALVSCLIILCEFGYMVYFAIKKGGIENKRDEVRRTIEGGIEEAKKLPKKSELRREQRAAAAKLKQEEKARKAEQKKLEAEQRKKQKEQARLEKEKPK